MFKYQSMAVIFAIVSFMGSSQAASEFLTEDKVVELALKRNELNAISRNQLRQAELRLQSARSNLFPRLTANASVQKFYIVPEKRLPGGLQINQGEISLVQPVYTFGRLSSGIEIANLDKDITANSATATAAEIEKIAKQLFYNAVFSKNLLKIAEESVANANKNRSALGERVSFGRINQNDNLKMQADVASRQPLLHEAKKNYQSSLQDLSYFLNLALEEIAEISTSLEELEKSMVAQKTVEDFVDVKQAAQGVRLSAAQKELESKNYLPTVSAFASYLPRHTPTSVAIPGVLLTDTAIIGLRMDMDIPLGGEKTYDQKIAAVALNTAVLNHQRVKREAAKQQVSMIQQYETLQEKSDSIKKAVNLADRAYQVALASFRNGSISQLQLNDSELLLTQNKINFVQNILQMKIIASELERLQTEGRYE